MSAKILEKDAVISERIRSARKAKGLTQEQLGEAVGVTKATINKYEGKGVYNIPRFRLEAICKTLSISPAYICGWTDDPTFVASNNSGVISIGAAQREVSKEEAELLRIYNALDVRARLELLNKAFELEASNT